MAVAARLLGATTLERRLPVGAARDELADLGQAFNDLLGRLQESFERQRRFTGDASHQLRTPLTAVLGQVEVALRRERTPEEYRAVLAKVRMQADHLGQVVEMLLFLARADAETRLTHLELVDLRDWLADHLRSRANHPREADFRTELAAGPLFARVHAPLLAQLVDNLLENAFKYSEPGSPVILRLTEAAGEAVLAIEDRGQGIAPEELPRIFEPFFRSEQARRQGLVGVGLGLAVARRIATAFGGVLEVESTLDAGSVFRLRLAAEAAPVTPSPNQTWVQPSRGFAAPR
jgi:signal transduction histidine kinase